MVDPPDIDLFQVADLPMQLVDTRDTPLQLAPGGFAFGDQVATFLDVEQLAIEVAPLTTFEHDDVAGGAFVAQPLAHHPGEIRAVDFTVAHLEQLAGHELAALSRHRQATGSQTR